MVFWVRDWLREWDCLVMLKSVEKIPIWNFSYTFFFRLSAKDKNAFAGSMEKWIGMMKLIFYTNMNCIIVVWKIWDLTVSIYPHTQLHIQQKVAIYRTTNYDFIDRIEICEHILTHFHTIFKLMALANICHHCSICGSRLVSFTFNFLCSLWLFKWIDEKNHIPKKYLLDRKQYLYKWKSEGLHAFNDRKVARPMPGGNLLLDWKANDINTL